MITAAEKARLALGEGRSFWDVHKQKEYEDWQAGANERQAAKEAFQMAWGLRDASGRLTLKAAQAEERANAHEAHLAGRHPGWTDLPDAGEASSAQKWAANFTTIDTVDKGLAESRYLEDQRREVHRALVIAAESRGMTPGELAALMGGVFSGQVIA
jgi:hypothetical protein